jgi:hypothetical protein
MTAPALTAGATVRPRLRARLALDLLASVAAVGLVVGGSAVILYAVDAVPAWITGEPRYVRKAASVLEVERRLRARLVLPYYYPSSLSWPPRHIRFTLGPPGAVALVVHDREGTPRLFLAETVGPGRIPERLLPEAQVLTSSPVAVGAAQATLARVVEDGTMGWQLTWEQGGRSLLIRSPGSVEELLRIARSVREAP